MNTTAETVLKAALKFSTHLSRRILDVHNYCDEVINDEVKKRVIFTFSDNSGIIFNMDKEIFAAVTDASSIKILPTEKRYYTVKKNEDDDLNPELTFDLHMIGLATKQIIYEDVEFMRFKYDSSVCGKFLKIVSDSRNRCLSKLDEISASFPAIREEDVKILKGHLKNYFYLSLEMRANKNIQDK
jgi:hypothetical protein